MIEPPKPTKGLVDSFLSVFSPPVLRAMFWAWYFMIAISLFSSVPFLALLLLLPAVWFNNMGKDRDKPVQRLRAWKSHKIRVGFSVAFVLFALISSSANADSERKERMIAEYPVPVIEILSATGDQGDAATYSLQFTASDTTAVTVNNSAIEPNDSGVYEDEIVLNDISTTLNIKAENAYKNAATSIVVTRNMTEEEITEKARKEAEAKAEAERKEAEAAAKLAQEEAAQRTWEQSKAGKICARHPEWLDGTCTDIANGNIWIGMEYDMLVEGRGKPSSTNPSNYGNGTQWQWCWSWDYDVSCFYDNNDDGIIDSYN